MNKDEYLHKLEICLKKYLSKAEVEDILRDYGEYFDDGRRQNKTDTEISAKLGAPEVIAQQFIDEYTGKKKEKTSEELYKMKEKATNSIHSAKEKISDVHLFGGMGKAIGGAVGLTGRFISCCIRLGLLGLLLLIGGFLEFALLCFLFGVSLAVLACVASGIFGFIFSITSFGFISMFFTAAGLFGSIALVCFGGLLALGVFFICKLNIIFLRNLLFKLLGINNNKEAA